MLGVRPRSPCRARVDSPLPSTGCGAISAGQLLRARADSERRDADRGGTFVNVKQGSAWKGRFDAWGMAVV